MKHKDLVLQAAFGYLERGWSILPVSRNKKPHIAWKEYQDRQPTPEEVVEWSEKYGDDFNIALACGEISGVTVVDVENGGPVDGLTPTLMSKTQGGGFHFIYKYEPGIGNGVRIRELTDIRGNGGYIILPPSEGIKGEYSWLNEEEPQPFPKSFLPLVKKQTSSFKNVGGVAYVSDLSKLPVYDGSAEGSRNDAMARYIGKVLKMVHPADWDTIAARAMIEANKLNNPPLDMRELESVYNSIKNREKLNPQIVLKNNVLEDKDIDNDEVDYMYKAADIARPTVREFYATGMNKIDNAIGGGWKNGDLVVITGRSGHGKTTVAETFSYNLVKNKHPVLFFSYEVLVDIVWDHFVRMGLTNENLIFAPLKTTTGKLDWVEKKIKEGIEKFGVKAVVLDHLGFLAPTETRYSDAYSANYAAYLTQMCRDLKSIARDNEIVIFLLAHVKKVDMKRDVSQEDISQSNGPLQESDFLFSIQRTPYSSEQIDKMTIEDFTKMDLDNKGQGEDLYGPTSKLSLLKNRMTGRSFWTAIEKEKRKGETDKTATGPFVVVQDEAKIEAEVKKEEKVQEKVENKIELVSDSLDNEIKIKDIPI